MKISELKRTLTDVEYLKAVERMIEHTQRVINQSPSDIPEFVSHEALNQVDQVALGNFVLPYLLKRKEKYVEKFAQLGIDVNN